MVKVNSVFAWSAVLLIFVSFAVGPSAHAGEYDDWYEIEHAPREPEPEYPAPIKKLLDQKSRPSIAEFVTAMNEAYGENGWPKENPFRSSHASSPRDLAVLIASFEYAFPGATYLGLGRDVVLLGDYLDAFYRSIGEPGRVRRLDASGPSFPHYHNSTPETAKTDRELLFGFLKTNGLNPNIEKMKYPYVMFDVTSWRSTSQSRQLIRAAYQTLQSNGQDLKAVYDQVNFLGIMMGSADHVIAPGMSVEEVKAAERKTITDEGPLRPLYLPSIATSLTYTEGWHDMFRSFERRADGRVTTEPGTDLRYSHSAILGEMYNVVAMMRDPELLTLVKKAANELGYEFPLKRTTTLTMLPKNEISKPDLFKKPELPKYSGYRSFGSYSSSSTSPEDMRLYMTTAKKRIAEALNPFNTAVDLFRDMAGMIDRGTATRANLRRLIGIIRGQSYLGDSLLNNKSLLRDFAYWVDDRPTVREYLVKALKANELKVFNEVEAIPVANCSNIIWPKSQSRWSRDDD